jgi:hypothetical protein
MKLRFRIHIALLLFCVIVMMRLQIRQLLQLSVVLNPFRQAPPLPVVELSGHYCMAMDCDCLFVSEDLSQQARVQAGHHIAEESVWSAHQSYT